MYGRRAGGALALWRRVRWANVGRLAALLAAGALILLSLKPAGPREPALVPAPVESLPRERPARQPREPSPRPRQRTQRPAKRPPRPERRPKPAKQRTAPAAPADPPKPQAPRPPAPAAPRPLSPQPVKPTPGEFTPDPA